MMANHPKCIQQTLFHLSNACLSDMHIMAGGWSKKKRKLQHLLNSLVGPLPSLSPSLLPPPSLDASLRAAAARATGGGGTLVEGGRAGQSPGWDPGLGLRPLPPHHCKQPPLGYTSPPRPLQMLTMTDDMSSANCVESSAKQREQ